MRVRSSWTAARGLAADRGVGKSSTLARLALDGIPIVADDLLVIDEIVALAGPARRSPRRARSKARGR